MSCSTPIQTPRDHTAGNQCLAKQFQDIKVYGPATEPIPAMTHPVQGQDTFQVGNLPIRVLDTACHTNGHVSYVVEGETPLLFPGDTLFVAGVGRFFEGTAGDMYRALYDEILQLPSHTLVYGGHNYALSNLRFARAIDPDNVHVETKWQQVKQQEKQKVPTVPTTLEQEMLYNPFLRVHTPEMAKVTGARDPIQILENLRAQKDMF